MTRIVLVDDHALIRAGVRAELETDFDIVGEAGDVPAAIDLISRSKPDVVVCDVPVSYTHLTLPTIYSV